MTKMISSVKSKLFENFNGVLLINKSSHITSYGIIREIKKIFF